MTPRKANKKNRAKCAGLNTSPCGICARQDDDHPDRLVMGMAHGKCIHFIRKT